VSDATEMTAGAGEATEVATEVDAVLAGLGQARKVGRYTLLELLGTGGMGVVFTAYDEELDRKVAIKFLQRSSADPQALLREAQAQARLAHPNVIHVYEVGVAEARVFLAMEFVRGQSLRAWSQVDRSWAEVVGIFVQAGRGLAAAHAAGVVHCDFKPDNVLVGADGRARVLDFGLAYRPGEPSLAAAARRDAGVHVAGAASRARRSTRGRTSSASAWRCSRRCTGSGRSRGRRWRRWSAGAARRRCRRRRARRGCRRGCGGRCGAGWRPIRRRGTRRWRRC
jgi:serine/threonine protein kinase